MSLSYKGKLIALGSMAAGAVVLSWATSRTKPEHESKAKAKDKGPTLEEVFQQGALLPEAVADDLMLPIELSDQPRTTGQGIVNGVINVPEQLDTIITDMAPERAQMAYENMLAMVRDEGYDLSNASARDEAVRRTVMVVAPNVDWSAGLQPYTFDSPEGLIWRSTEMLGEMAHQSFWNKNTALGA